MHCLLDAQRLLLLINQVPTAKRTATVPGEEINEIL
jgi:hypothetical protein